MDAGLSNFLVNDSSLATDEQGVGFVSPQNLLPMSSPSAPQSAPAMAQADEQPLGFTDSVLPQGQRVHKTSRSLDVSHASPLSPLRMRDRAALDDIFHEDDLSEIVLDIHRHLSRLYPEPSWEDEPYEFLNGYI
ncbi:MAG: hypothetical protein F6K00_13500 [Leptolyngbya sp. SIOISBB]|nr:hypothetical protein [Leptolyngbya sp. SIOISBB]